MGHWINQEFIDNLALKAEKECREAKTEQERIQIILDFHETENDIHECARLSKKIACQLRDIFKLNRIIDGGTTEKNFPYVLDPRANEKIDNKIKSYGLDPEAI